MAKANYISTYSPVTPSRPISADTPTATGTSGQKTTRRRVKRNPKNNSNAGAGAGAAAGRAVGREAKPPVDPLAAEIEALVTQKYGGAQSALRTQAKAVPGYFEDYRNRLKQISGGLVGNPQPGQPLGGVYGAGVNSTQQLAQTQAQGSATVAATAAGNANSQVAGDAAKAAAVRQGMIANYGGLIASQGVAEAGYLGNRAASSGPLQIQAQQAAAQAKADLKREKGAYRVTARADSEAAAQKAALEAQLFGLDVAKERNDVIDQNRDRRVTARNNRRSNETSRQNNAVSNATSRANAQDRIAAQQEKDRKAAEKDHKERQAKTKDIINRFNLLKKYTKTVTTPGGSGGGLAHGAFPNVTTVHMTHDELVAALVKEGFTTVEINHALKVRKKRRVKANKKADNQSSSYTPNDASGA